MHYALLFMMIFGAALLLAAAGLAFSKDPRDSFLLARVPGLKKMGKDRARKTAREIAAAVAGVGLAILIYCAVGIYSGA